MRDYWRGANSMLSEFAARFTGSSDLYKNDYRHPTASVNFITAHDGFTLNDLVSYNEKHNLANGEDNKDGESHNRSWNCGVEGETDDPAIKALRERQKRNFLTTLFLSQGVPMLSAGDELGRTQNGNNNAYCHDNELSWINWQKADKDLLEFTKKLIHLYKEHNVFSRRDWFKGQSIKGEGLHDIGWFSPEGIEMTEDNWKQDFAKALGVYLNGRGIHAMDYNGEPIIDDSFYVIFNAHNEPLIYKLPPPIYGNNWIKILDTGKNFVSEKGGRTYKANSRVKVEGYSVVLLKQPQQEK
jgi:glycogen operon protein